MIDLSKSIDFLLENAGPVIQYRLHKEILKDISEAEEENLLEKVFQTPHFRLLQTYVKPNGYIGIGMHSWDKFKETPLQDGEAAARLLSYYAVPKNHPIISNFVAAMRDETILEQEFSYYKPETVRFRDRFLGLRNGGGLMVLIYTMQALLGYGDDDCVLPFQSESLQTFKSILPLTSMNDITKFNPNSKKKYNYPYIEENEYFPCSYHLTALAYTSAWRTPENADVMADAINHICRIMSDDNLLHVKLRSKYYCPLWALIRPIRPFSTDTVDSFLRRMLTEIAMLGVGRRVEVLRQTEVNIEEALGSDGILRLKFGSAYQRRRYLQSVKWPYPYSDVGLEADYKNETALWCDLTFWAVQFLTLMNAS